MSICLRLKHKLCIQKNSYICVLQVTLAIYKNTQKGLSESDTPMTQATCLVVVLHIVCNWVVIRIINTYIQRSFIYTVAVVATSVYVKVWVHCLNKKCRGLSSIKLTRYTIYTNINACRVQQRYSQIIKFTQQHIIKYKSRCSSHTCILSRFLLTIFHAYHKQSFTHLTSASTSMLGLPSAPPVKLWPAGYTSHVN